MSSEQKCTLRGVTLTIVPNSSLETVASQLQPYTDKFLYVRDGIILGWFNNLDEVPQSKRLLEPTGPSDLGKEYYIRDLTHKQLWCCFDERLRNRLLGIDIPDIRLPVIASFIPVRTIEPISASPISDDSSDDDYEQRSETNERDPRKESRKEPSEGKSIEPLLPPARITRKTYATNKTETVQRDLSRLQTIDMSTSVEAAAPVVKQEKL